MDEDDPRFWTSRGWPRITSIITNEKINVYLIALIRKRFSKNYEFANYSFRTIKRLIEIYIIRFDKNIYVTNEHKNQSFKNSTKLKTN